MELVTMTTSSHTKITVGFHSTQFPVAEWQDAFDELGSHIQLNAINQMTDKCISDINVLLIWKPSVTDWRAAIQLRHVI